MHPPIAQSLTRNSFIPIGVLGNLCSLLVDWTDWKLLSLKLLIGI